MIVPTQFQDNDANFLGFCRKHRKLVLEGSFLRILYAYQPRRSTNDIFAQLFRNIHLHHLPTILPRTQNYCFLFMATRKSPYPHLLFSSTQNLRKLENNSRKTPRSSGFKNAQNFHLIK